MIWLWLIVAATVVLVAFIVPLWRVRSRLNGHELEQRGHETQRRAEGLARASGELYREMEHLRHGGQRQ